MSTLHRYLKYKLGGKSIFAKVTDLAKLTERLLLLNCGRLQYKKEAGTKKETIGVASVEIPEIVQLHMDRFLKSMVPSQQMFHTAPSAPLYQKRLMRRTKEYMYLLVPIMGRGRRNLWFA